MKMNLVKFILFFSYFYKFISASLNQNELNLSFDLITRLEIRHLLLIQKECGRNLFYNIKKFATANFSVAYLNFSQLENYITENKNVSRRTGFLLDSSENLTVLENVIKKLDEVS